MINKTITSEFKWDEKKLIEKLMGDNAPSFTPRKEFKDKLDTKIQDKISITKEQQASQATMDAVPRKVKWRFYLTGYGYAVVSFVALFLIWFCTNIFTWTLKVPTKYTFLEENEAFWSLKNGELAYYYDTNKASNFTYDINEANEIYEEDALEREETEDHSTKSLNSISKIVETQALWSTITAKENNIENTDTWEDDDIYYPDYLLNRNFTFNQTYRFTYKDKIFPKLALEYPIYKSSWILMWSNTPNQVLKNLKIWDVSFKKFQDLEIAGLYIEQKTKNWYTISFDSDSQTLNFYPNDSRQAQKFNDKLPSKKQIIRAVEKDLKQLGISIKNYWNGEIDTENYDEDMWIVNILYPFKIQWKEVWDTETEKRIWMEITYDLNLQKVVSVIWIDIATYDVSKYPTIDKAYIEKEIEKWWEFFNQWALHENSTVVLFDNIQIVYITKYQNGAIYYIPAIKWEVETSIENYKWPRYVFQGIVQ